MYQYLTVPHQSGVLLQLRGDSDCAGHTGTASRRSAERHHNEVLNGLDSQCNFQLRRLDTCNVEFQSARRLSLPSAAIAAARQWTGGSDLQHAPPHATSHKNKGENSFTLLRFVLAALVILSHASGHEGGIDPLVRLFHTISFGELAVDAFFVLSGFLVTASWDRSPVPWKFLRKRILRIYPGFIASFLISVLIIGPIGAWDVQSYIGHLDSTQLVISAALLKMPTTPHVFSGSVVNQALWTVHLEFACYLLLLGLGFARVLERKWAIILLWASALTGKPPNGDPAPCVDGPLGSSGNLQNLMAVRKRSCVRPVYAAACRRPMCGRHAEVKDEFAKFSGGSRAVMCSASSCGVITAGLDRFRERYPNRWAVFIYHGPARILSFVGSTDHYLLLCP